MKTVRSITTNSVTGGKAMSDIVNNLISESYFVQLVVLAINPSLTVYIFFPVIN